MAVFMLYSVSNCVLTIFVFDVWERFANDGDAHISFLGNVAVRGHGRNRFENSGGVE